MPNPMEIEYDFNDATMVEAGGRYDEVEKLFRDEPFGGSGWMVKTAMTVQSMIGLGVFILHLFQNKDVIVVDYQPSTPDIWSNPDISFLSVWAQENGWNLPKVSNDLSQGQMKFWKHFWDSNLIDSDFYRKRFQKKHSPFLDIKLEEDEQEGEAS